MSQSRNPFDFFNPRNIVELQIQLKETHMKSLTIAAFLVLATTAFAQTEMLNSKIAQAKKKGCPMVNGKEDCTVTEVKTKVLEVKKSITK